MRKKRKEVSNNVESADNEISIAPTIDLSLGYSEPAKEIDSPLIDVSQIKDGDEPFLGITPGGDEPRQKRKYKKRDKPEDGELPMIDGEMLLMFIDIIIPMIITTASNQLTGTKVSPDDISLTEKQKSQMKKLADKCAERIDINVNPFLGLLVGVGGIYTMNYMNATKTKS
jgi:hypothetical protein